MEYRLPREDQSRARNPTPPVPSSYESGSSRFNWRKTSKKLRYQVIQPRMKAQAMSAGSGILACPSINSRKAFANARIKTQPKATMTAVITAPQARATGLGCILCHRSTLQALDNSIFRSNLRGLEYQERGMRTSSQRTNMTTR